MKIALAQINTTVGALEGNARRILVAYEQAAAMGADLVVFPEMALTGYPPRDLLELPAFVRENVEALEELAAQMTGPGAIVGYAHPRLLGERPSGAPPTGAPSSPDDLRWMNVFSPELASVGKGLYNAAALIDGGQVISRHFKALLPTYDVFDEARHFDAADAVQTATFRGTRLGISICEDFWNDAFDAATRRLYARNPIRELAEQGVDLMINISASPYSFGKRQFKSKLYQRAVDEYRVPLIVVNQVGGNDNLIFDGWSNVWLPGAGVGLQAEAFKEDLLLWDSEAAQVAHLPQAQEGDETVYEALKLGIRDYVGKCGFKQVLIGLSGGIDSALTAVLAADALGPENVVGISMPSQFSSGHSKDDARELAENLGIAFHTIAIEPIYRSFLGQLEPLFAGTQFGLAEENIQARTRGNLLMAISNKFGYLVLSTGNKSEMAVGYCTLYGDMSGGLSVLADVLKTRVFSISRWINRNKERIPRSTIEKPPSAELRPDQKDSDSLPEYDVLDPIIQAYIEEMIGPDEIIARGHAGETVRRVIRMIDRAEYKRQQAALCLKVSGKAFGSGRRMPIARGR